MSKPLPFLSALPESMGIGLAAKLAGVPIPTLRYQVDAGKVPGVHRTPSRRRRISREGLLAYMQARGIDPRRLRGMERRGADRIGWPARPRVTQLTILQPGSGKFVGQGSGALKDLSPTGFRLKDLSWKGYLPGPETLEVAFRVSNTGRHRRSEGRAEVAWIEYRSGKLGMGLRILNFKDGESKKRWEEFVKAGHEVAVRHAEGLEAAGRAASN